MRRLRFLTAAASTGEAEVKLDAGAAAARRLIVVFALETVVAALEVEAFAFCLVLGAADALGRAAFGFALAFDLVFIAVEAEAEGKIICSIFFSSESLSESSTATVLERVSGPLDTVTCEAESSGMEIGRLSLSDESEMTSGWARGALEVRFLRLVLGFSLSLGCENSLG